VGYKAQRVNNRMMLERGEAETHPKREKERERKRERGE